MRKLELKDIVGYLPYGLKILEGDKERNIVDIFGCYIHGLLGMEKQ